VNPTYPIGEEIHVLPSIFPVPVLGPVPVNAYLVRGEEPYLVDTGLYQDRDQFLATLQSLIDLADLRWIYLTHDDGDHIGALQPLLGMAPNARVITTFTAMGKLVLLNQPLDPARVYLLNPGEALELADRRLTAIKPPVFDSPATTGVYDSRLDALFSADSFGSPLSEVPALANDVPPEVLASSQLTWTSFDAPWVHAIDRERFAASLQVLRKLDPRWLLSSHLPPAFQLTATLCDTLARAPDGPPFVSPDQRTFAAMLASPPAPL